MRQLDTCILIAIISVFASCCNNKDEGSKTELPTVTAAPLIWGFDDAGMDPTPSVEEKIIEDFGFDLVVHHFQPSKSGNESKIRTLSDFYSENGTKWILNLETANWRESFIDDNGRDWYNDDQGRHYFMFPEEILKQLSTLEHKPGIMYDEAAHMQNANNSTTIEGFEKPFFLKAEDVASLEMASDHFIKEAGQIADIYKNHGLTIYTEHVFPIQFHTFAAAGFIPVSKILKENCIPAYIASSLGAAIQYNRPFWLTPDLWFRGSYPGHSNERYRSALLMAYHMGVQCIYTENIGYDQDQGKGSLISMNQDHTDYQITELGKIAKWFRFEYVPQNPRYYTFDELIPRVAIIRQEDACWGQSDSWLPDQLFGNKTWQSTESTEAWLEIWNLLSNGQISPHSVSWHNSSLRQSTYNIFYPLDGVVVFDEKVQGKHLNPVELIFLTGVGISQATQDAVRLRVKQGAVCISLPHLAPAEVVNAAGENGVLSDEQGNWVITKSFLSPIARQYANSFLPKENHIRYRFGDKEVQFRPIDENGDDIEAIINTN